MRSFLLALFLASFLAGCFEVPAGTSPVRGTEMGVIVHNFALAYRDFLRAEHPASFLPPYLSSPLPMTDAEWRADDVTSPVAVSTATDSFSSISKVQCGPVYCVRTVERKYTDGFRIDEKLQISYRRGVTTTAEDDTVLGFHSTLRYRDQVISETAATEPTSGQPWRVEDGFSFSSEDSRLQFTRNRSFPSMTSTAAARSADVDYVTKDGHTYAKYRATSQGFGFTQDVTYETLRHLASGSLSFVQDDQSFKGQQQLHYKSGVDVTPVSVTGLLEDWLLTGDTVAKGAVAGKRSGTAWRREITFPGGQRFKTLTDEGVYAAHGGRGTFTRTIVGQNATLTFTGTYKQKAPGIWEVSAEGTGGIRIDFIYQPLELSEVFAGHWVQPNARVTAPDNATFLITVNPDWTSRMSYEYDRSDVPYTPDETGVLRFTPDTRGTARVSVVQEKAGDKTRHKDYSLAIVAEGQKP